MCKPAIPHACKLQDSELCPWLFRSLLTKRSFVLRRNYSSTDADAGKSAAKAELRSRMGLSGAEAPLVAVVTRLTHQKGIHLIKHAAWRTLERGAQFVLLGSAPDPRVQVRAPAGTCPINTRTV